MLLAAFPGLTPLRCRRNSAEYEVTSLWDVWKVPILEGHVVLLCRQVHRCLTSGCTTAAISLFISLGVFMLLSVAHGSDSGFL